MKRFLVTLLAGSLLAALFGAPIWAANNIQLNAGSGGDLLKAEDDGTAKHQEFLIEFGTAGTQTRVDAANPLPVVTHGTVAHDSPVADEPVQIGGEARTSLPTAVGNGDVARLMTDDLGRLVTTSFCPRDLITQNTITLTTTTETTLIATGGAGVFRDIVLLILSNESPTEIRVAIRDSTGGTIRLPIDLAANGGGAVMSFNPPFIQGTADNNWSAELSVADSSVYITAQTCDQN